MSVNLNFSFFLFISYFYHNMLINDYSFVYKSNYILINIGSIIEFAII